ncbi:hypothetical protein PFICI_09461 [Pestalotiopsis fici W106-1]|uniref:mRNA export factor GLE1 n=1 Tax=Pestalotiopsis fici (strain W106-1 / CGMCC3.15140) TaxID=1229662 RepID=W3X0E2_PESFW|nr:uncharacterized protein PFICI_09461 [Pestalotiopsis fici W106-1]ETS79608.1 hypothetical protein PFICI_09461 [Pestalotiopsis fici W106-1]
MAGTSPVRPSLASPSPDRHRYGSYLSDDRNNISNHHEALAASKDEHDRVRDHAIQALEKHAFQLEQLRIHDEETRVLEKQKREQVRLEQERRLREEEKKLRELEAQHIPKLPPKPPAETAPPAAQAKDVSTNGIKPAAPSIAPKGASSENASATSKSPFTIAPPTEKTNGTVASNAKPAPTPSAQEAAPAAIKQDETATKPNPFATIQSSSAAPSPSPFAAAGKSATPVPTLFGKPTGAPAINGLNTATTTAPVPVAVQSPDRYVQIHQSLKKLRASIKQQMTTNVELKKNAGNMRREIRKCIGQLTGEKGANRQQLEKIRAVLTAAVRGSPPSALVDPSEYVRDQRQPDQEALHNGELPSLFLYLLNCLAKDMIKQFDGECGPMPHKADPIGVIAAQIFSTKEFQWRGISLVDIMMAKFRVACPVLFGIRGNEKMEQGRLRLGWRKPDGHWMPDQQHYERMSGLGVGYASIALRDFSKVKTRNPYPPANYWTSMAKIVNSPSNEISDTQCVVLRAMIHLYEEKFINLYGNQAIAALRKALVEFPAKAPNKTPAVHGLTVLASLYEKDLGLDLR